jgi:hypothetical protein
MHKNGQSNNSKTLSRISSSAGYVTHISDFRKRHLSTYADMRPALLSGDDVPLLFLAHLRACSLRKSHRSDWLTQLSAAVGLPARLPRSDMN